jgi:hypothetical protein
MLTLLQLELWQALDTASQLFQAQHLQLLRQLTKRG